MVDLTRLRGLIAECELSQRKVAHLMGMAEKTFYNKMKTGNFLLSEAARLIDILDIEDPAAIFFADDPKAKRKRKK